MAVDLPGAAAWSTAALAESARGHRAAAARLRRTADRLTAPLPAIDPDALAGPQRDHAAASLARRARALRGLAVVLDLAGGRLDAGGARIGAAREGLRTALRRARDHGMAVDAAGRARPGPGLLRALALAPGAGAALLLLARADSLLIRRALAGVRAADATTADRLAGAWPGAPGRSELRGHPRWPAVTAVAARGGGRVLETGPDSTALIAYGDPATAAHLIVLVPGTGSDPLDPLSVHGQGRRARAILDRATAATAVVVALHDAPPDLLAAAGDDHHPAAAAQLRTAVARLAAAHPGAAVSVLGHSHGAVVAAQAARGPGLRADALMLLGSPGAGPGVTGAGDLRLLDAGGRPHRGTGQVHSVRDPHDPVGLAARAGIHGADPEDPGFGAPGPAAAESPPAPVERAHASYFEDPRRLRAIIAALEEDAGLAPAPPAQSKSSR
ncbi:alpha/beta hydrolase [Corynebacterium sphenisci]|uniref:alpha/beta hydrolase n=1 Tax=Corynebacterium sphenisci TaxID=191493 RepID=UPI0026E025C0|nr:alpha/beta hydrolase [Corynebacterium sphenisci]MDO5731620.1 alpha/beta hydrolase [Corynebacterium sphenisci]